MNKVKLLSAYVSSILIIPFGIFGIFHSSFFQFESDILSLYIKLSSIFITVVSILAAWYYSNIFIRKDVLSKMTEFGTSIMNSDFRKISKENVPDIAKETISKLQKYEDFKFELFGFSIPFFTIFLTTLAMSMHLNSGSILPYILGCLILMIIIKFANIMVSICDIRAHENYLVPTLSNISLAAKGIQYYDSFKFVQSKLNDEEKLILQQTKIDISKVIWRSFFYMAALFIFILAFCIIKKEYASANLFNIDSIENIYIFSMLIYILFLVSFFRYLKINELSISDISKYQSVEEIENDKKIDEDNLFIAMHGVYFQDPTRLSEFPVLSNLSMSVLPGEFISITGKNHEGMAYVFDLLLSYYKVQSGNIYLAGTKIDNISKQKIRSLIGFFDENFGLIPGTIYDNLEMMTSNQKKILAISEKVGLQEDLQENIFSEDGELILSQELLFRLQIGRITIQKPKILFIKTPNSFESERTEKIFYEFVEFSSKRKTVLIITNNPKIIVYSDKILYIANGESLFGTHADLSKNENYQKYIKNL